MLLSARGRQRHGVAAASYPNKEAGTRKEQEGSEHMAQCATF